MKVEQVPTSYEAFYVFDPHSGYDPSFATLSDAEELFRSQMTDQPCGHPFAFFARRGKSVTFSGIDLYADPVFLGTLVSITQAVQASVSQRMREVTRALEPEEEFELAVRLEPIETRPLVLEITSRIVASPSPILDALED